MQILIEASQTEKRLFDKDELHKIYCRTFSSNDGKMILEDLATTCGMYRSNFVQGSSEYTSFLEGQRSLFLYICSQLAEKINNIEGRE